MVNPTRVDAEVIFAFPDLLRAHYAEDKAMNRLRRMFQFHDLRIHFGG